MPANFPPQSTDLTLDVLGRFTCNTLEEAQTSMSTTIDADARPFDFIIIGGGSFGSVLASHLLQRDGTRSHRILVLEAGPFVLPEHVQNLPPGFAADGLSNPAIWSVPWDSDSPASWNQQFPGLAFCLGGRSLFWGGWSPRMIASELDPADWPASVINDLTTPVLNVGARRLSYFDEASEQIGTATTNDYIYGPLHGTLVDRLLTRFPVPVDGTVLLGAVGQNATTPQDLEAPLAVQSAPSRPGTFPLNKFNGVQLLLRAARLAQSEAEQSGVGTLERRNAKKRLMVVDNTKVISLQTSNGRVVQIVTNKGTIDVPPQGKVILANGTIESTRLALETVPDPNGLIGRNLMAHLRSNLTIRIPRPSLARVDQAMAELTTLAGQLSGTNIAQFAQRAAALNAAPITEFRDGPLAQGQTVGVVAAANDAIARVANASAAGDVAATQAAFADLTDAYGTLTSKLRELQVSAMFVKGVHTFPTSTGHFHFQITASGVGALGMDSEAELFKKIPNIDELERFEDLTDSWIVITIRGIGEMFGNKGANTISRITLEPNGSNAPYDYGTRRALVRLDVSQRELDLWREMDNAAVRVAQALAAGGPIQYLNSANGTSYWDTSVPPANVLRDKLSSTHHEAGTLWMGNNVVSSVTDEWGAFWSCPNLHAVGPAIQPRLGSPNPMLTGVALTRRIGDRLLRDTSTVQPPVVTQPNPVNDAGFEFIFDGTQNTFNNWVPVGQGAFALINGTIVVQPGSDIGLLYHAKEAFGDVVIRAEFRLTAIDDNSGVFVRFRDPRRPLRLRNNAVVPYDNQAFVGVDSGFEVQIDELARGNQLRGEPDGMDKKRTGAIYDIPTDGSLGYQQQYHRANALRPGNWNLLEVWTVGNSIRVFVNGQLTSSYENTDAYRGQPTSAADPFAGFLGLQSHTGRTAFRRIRVMRNAVLPAQLAAVRQPARAPQSAGVPLSLSGNGTGR
jgi:choline dehydrogenase-like flavoprotein